MLSSPNAPASDRSHRLTVFSVGFLVVVVVQAAVSAAKDLADQELVAMGVDLLVLAGGITVIDFVRRLAGQRRD